MMKKVNFEIVLKVVVTLLIITMIVADFIFTQGCFSTLLLVGMTLLMLIAVIYMVVSTTIDKIKSIIKK